MGATLVMVVSLVVILGLILVLLVELYCSFLLHRRQNRNSNPQTTTTTTIANAFSPSHSPTPHPPHQQQHSPPPPPPPFTSICSQGVLRAPRSILFPPFSSIHDLPEPKKQHQQLSELHQVIPIQTQDFNDSANANSHCIGLVSVPSSLQSFMSRAPSKPFQQDSLQGTTTSIETIDKTCSGGEHLVYISNPIYENEEGKESEPNTPFETPDTSPSRLERSGSSSSDDDEVEVSHCGVQTLLCTPPLTPMKKLPDPEKACSVSLRDARSLGTSGSESHSNNVLFSSSSASPYTSPSWIWIGRVCT
ncbi:unnamed protein product [Lupinus luteus]|uniref:Hydroxyproline-rich glycoprotein family protein n=1 Tax=Lupinus luteus TaxID=3873 RepID=A0AAV1XKW1_LUPLU